MVLVSFDYGFIIVGGFSGFLLVLASGGGFGVVVSFDLVVGFDLSPLSSSLTYP